MLEGALDRSGGPQKYFSAILHCSNHTGWRPRLPPCSSSCYLSPGPASCRLHTRTGSSSNSSLIKPSCPRFALLLPRASVPASLKQSKRPPTKCQLPSALPSNGSGCWAVYALSRQDRALPLIYIGSGKDTQRGVPAPWASTTSLWPTDPISQNLFSALSTIAVTDETARNLGVF